MSQIGIAVLAILAVSVQEGNLGITPKGDGTRVEVSAVLPKDAKLPAGKISQDDGELWLQCCLMTDGKPGPAMLGTYDRDGERLTFVPRFPLQPEKTYQASLLHNGKTLETTTYKVPARKPSPPAEVVAVWPANDLVPANLLRFHIEFNRPMRGGPDIFDQIMILDADGKEVTDPWLREELWNEDGTKLTVYIHPGRIKWGVLLRWLLGPVLEPDRRYTVVISDKMLDADERKLAKTFRKSFRTSAEERNRIEISEWIVQPPKIGTREAVSLTFPKTLDRPGLKNFLKIVDAQERPLPGKIEIAVDGRKWTFVPDMAWSAQEYKIAVDAQLEDVSGNTPVHPFDVDTEAPVPPAQRMWLGFRPNQ